MASHQELRILTPVGMLGYGFDEKLFLQAVKDGVDAIIVDSGSTDSGPSNLASGHLPVAQKSYESNLDMLLGASDAHKIPILIGSAGGDGSDEHVNMLAKMVEEIIKERNLRPMKLVKIYAEVDKSVVKDEFALGNIIPCGKAVPRIQEADIDDAPHIVAQMGHEPFLEAMGQHPDFDIIIAGRAYDPAPYAAFCYFKGFKDMGTAYHMGKIMECGALCAQPKAREAIATVGHGYFDIRPLTPYSKCTKTSVAAHTLYEKTRPDILLGPGGLLDLNGTSYEELPDEQSVRVRGAKFRPDKADEYKIKLEGARVVGYHTTLMGAVRDPILISQIDFWLKMIQVHVKTMVDFSEFKIKFYKYGINGVMGDLEANDQVVPREVALHIHVKAPTQAQADQLCNAVKVCCLHMPYPGQIATSGNFAVPCGMKENSMGELSEFCIYHLMPLKDPTSLFPIHMTEIHPTSNDPNDRDPRPMPADDGSGYAKLQQEKKIASMRAMECKFKLTPDPPPGQCYLGDIASVIRSKNAGPYELTFDIMFYRGEKIYQDIKNSGILNEKLIAELYHIDVEDVITCLWWDPAYAFKATIKRPIVSGSFGESDVQGSAHHTPFLYILLPIPRPSD